MLPTQPVAALSRFPDGGAIEGTLKASDGYELFYRRWSPPQAVSVRSRICVLHGIQSHSGWYGYSSRQLADCGHEVWFPDRRGSGKNQINRGHADHWRRLVADVVQFLHQLRGMSTAANPVPVILMGVSWGGRLATAVAGQRPELVEGLGLLYPALVPRIRPTRWQKFRLGLAKLFGKHRISVPIPLDDPALFTQDPVWQAAIRDDPWALHEVTTGFLIANRELDALIRQAAEQIRCPALMMLAGQDRIIENPQTRALFEQFRHARRTFREYPTACHTLEFEPDRQQYVNDLAKWLDEVVSTRNR